MKLTYNDEKHSYYLDGRHCKSVTTVAKIPDDTYRLSLWSQRQVAIGMASDADLVEAVAAHANDDRKLDELCEQAKHAAGANRASRRGTAAHRVTELFDEGREIIETALSTAILDAWASALDAAGLEVVPELMERIVVYPDRNIAGKFDRIMRRKSDGRLVIADLKSGARAVQYPHGIATQLALYANAPLLAAPLPPEGGTTTEFETMHDVDRSVGYVIHIPENGEPAVVRFDIAAGWQCVERIIWPTLEWRDRKDIVLAAEPVEVRPRVQRIVPVSTTPEHELNGGEGPYVPQKYVDDLKKRLNVLLNGDDDWHAGDEDGEPACPAAFATVQAIYSAAQAESPRTHGISFTKVASRRRTYIIRALLALAEHFGDDLEDDHLRCVGLVIADAAQPGVPIHRALLAMNCAEAERFHRVALAVCTGEAVLHIAADGTAIWQADVDKLSAASAA